MLILLILLIRLKKSSMINKNYDKRKLMNREDVEYEKILEHQRRLREEERADEERDREKDEEYDK